LILFRLEQKGRDPLAAFQYFGVRRPAALSTIYLQFSKTLLRARLSSRVPSFGSTDVEVIFNRDVEALPPRRPVQPQHAQIACGHAHFLQSLLQRLVLLRFHIHIKLILKWLSMNRTALDLQ